MTKRKQHSKVKKDNTENRLQNKQEKPQKSERNTNKRSEEKNDGATISQQTAEQPTYNTEAHIPRFLLPKNIRTQDVPHWRIFQLTAVIVGLSLMGNGITLWQSCSNLSIIKMENRAYIDIGDVQIKDVRVGKIPTIHYEIKNIGKTPAYKTKFAIPLILGVVIPETLIYELRGELPDTGYVLASEHPMSDEAYFERVWTIQDSLDVVSKKLSLFFIVTVVYEDKFGEPHFSQIVFIYVPRKDYLGILRKYVRMN